MIDILFFWIIVQLKLNNDNLDPFNVERLYYTFKIEVLRLLSANFVIISFNGVIFNNFSSYFYFYFLKILKKENKG